MSREIRDPDRLVSLHDAVAAVGHELGLPEPGGLHGLIEAWPEIVGPALAPHTRVRSVRDGECVVEVDGAAWATRLRYSTDTVLAAVARRFGADVVTRVKVVVAAP